MLYNIIFGPCSSMTISSKLKCSSVWASSYLVSEKERASGTIRENHHVTCTFVAIKYKREDFKKEIILFQHIFEQNQENQIQWWIAHIYSQNHLKYLKNQNFSQFLHAKPFGEKRGKVWFIKYSCRKKPFQYYSYSRWSQIFFVRKNWLIDNQ